MSTPLTLLMIIVAMVIIGAGWVLFRCTDDWCLVFDWQRIAAADNFERCAQLGFPVIETYPRQCRAGDKVFTEPAQFIEDENVRLFTPQPNSIIRSPLTVRGEARGTWFFEASFPVALLDSNGKQLAIVPAQAQGEWMTTEFVPFEVIISFLTPTTETGTLVLEKDNPSGLPEHADSVSVPVRFSK